MNGDVPQSQPPRSLTIVCAAALLLLCGSAFALRAFFVKDQILTQDGVRFAVMDCWYHVRLVENLVAHFPWISTFDPYGVYPGGQVVPVAPLLDWLLAAASLLIAAGSPTEQVIHRVCAFAPAVIGALLPIPAYLLGKLMYNRTAGLLAAGLTAIAPGHLLSRSLLGYTDHHVLEVLLMAMTVFMFARASQRARNPDSPRSEKRPWHLIALGVACGLSLSVYLLTWIGGTLLVGILLGWLVLHWIIDTWQASDARYLAWISIPAFVTSIIVLLPLGTHLPAYRYHRLALMVGVAVMIVLLALTGLIDKGHVKRQLFPVLVVAAGVVGYGALMMMASDVAKPVESILSGLLTAHEKSLIPETRPLFMMTGEWSWRPAWKQFGSSLIVAVPAMIASLVIGIRSGSPMHTLIAVWSGALLVLTLGQNRFAYYLAFAAALLSGWTCAHLFRGLHEWAGRKSERQPGAARRNEIVAQLAGAACVIGLFLPSATNARASAGQIATPHPDWIAAMRWLRHETPPPLGDDQAYYAHVDVPPDGVYEYPADSYSIMNSWGFGYWITSMAHRIPVANPGQRGASTAARFFLSQSPAEAAQIAREVKSRYVVIESSMPYLRTPDGRIGGRMSSLAHWSGKPLTEFSETWYRREASGVLRAFQVFYPAYYQSLLARLYVFRGRAIDPDEVYVLSFMEESISGGEPIKLLVGMERFDDYASARQYAASRPASNTRLAGFDPLSSCTPLNAMEGEFELRYQSPTVRMNIQDSPVAHIEIYEISERAGDE
ncbi:MAG: oligosaccharyl transferase, archaeosortase A system-associated [Planctomycetota bacterium]